MSGKGMRPEKGRDLAKYEAGYDKIDFGTVAQLVERLTCNEDVAGSTPVSTSTSELISE